jgi:hypothetical protein
MLSQLRPRAPSVRAHDHFVRRWGGLAIDKLPSRSEPNGRALLWQTYLSGDIQLLLVVDRGAFELLALWIGSTRCGRPGLAIC